MNIKSGVYIHTHRQVQHSFNNKAFDVDVGGVGGGKGEQMESSEAIFDGERDQKKRMRM
jgi:hypothetical protein